MGSSVIGFSLLGSGDDPALAQVGDLVGAVAELGQDRIRGTPTPACKPSGSAWSSTLTWR
jgi:hypothetical protein